MPRPWADFESADDLEKESQESLIRSAKRKNYVVFLMEVVVTCYYDIDDGRGGTEKRGAMLEVFRGYTKCSKVLVDLEADKWTQRRGNDLWGRINELMDKRL